MSVTRTSIKAAPSFLREALLSWRNPDGGWPYYPGKSSRLEPTCWAALALTARGESVPIADVLARWRQASGLYQDLEHGPINYAFNGLAALALGSSAGAAGRELAAAAAIALADVKGIQIASSVNRQNNRLQAWPWIGGTFSWVEPTALCMLALKQAGRWRSGSSFPARVAEAEALLIDRACLTGGWNYGNANMLGAELPAHVPTTCLALLALQDRREHAAVDRALGFLDGSGQTDASTLSLALKAITFHVFGRDAAATCARLARQAERARELENLLFLSAALYALEVPHHGAAAFTL